MAKNSTNPDPATVDLSSPVSEEEHSPEEKGMPANPSIFVLEKGVTAKFQRNNVGA